MKKSVFLIIFSLFLVNNIISQTITFKFYDYKTKTPLANILIFSGNKVAGITDNIGRVEIDKNLIVNNTIKPFSYLYATYNIELLETDKNLKVELSKFEEKPELRNQIVPEAVYPLVEKMVKIVEKTKKQFKFSAKYFNAQFNEYFLAKERKNYKKDSKNEITLTFKKNYNLKSEIQLDDTVKNGLTQLYSCDPIRNNFDEMLTQSDKYVYIINTIVYNEDLANNIVEIGIKNKEIKENAIVGNIIMTLDGTNILQYSKEIVRSQSSEYMPKYLIIYSNEKNKIPYYVESMNTDKNDDRKISSTNKLYLR